METFAIPSPLLRCQLDLFGVMQLRCLSAIDRTCQWPSSHFTFLPPKIPLNKSPTTVHGTDPYPQFDMTNCREERMPASLMDF